MGSSSSNADEGASPSPPDGGEVASKWVVRLFLILAFGLAFGIEGMTLVRSFVLDGETGEEEVVGEAETAARVDVGDDLLPATSVMERIEDLRIRAQPDGPWTFVMNVVVQNVGPTAYRLGLRDLQLQNDDVVAESRSVLCPAADTAHLSASWSMGPNGRPASLTVVGEVHASTDSSRTVRRQVSFGHVPVQMER